MANSFQMSCGSEGRARKNIHIQKVERRTQSRYHHIKNFTIY